MTTGLSNKKICKLLRIALGKESMIPTVFMLNLLIIINQKQYHLFMPFLSFIHTISFVFWYFLVVRI